MTKYPDLAVEIMQSIQRGAEMDTAIASAGHDLTATSRTAHDPAPRSASALPAQS